jgi:hypothetical protein
LRVGSAHIPRLKSIANFMVDRMVCDKYQCSRPPVDHVCVNRQHPEQTRALWRWAISCIYTEVHRKHYAGTWESIRHRRDDRVCMY